MYPIFISYARRSGSDVAQALHKALRPDAFLDESNIDPGTRFTEQIVNALLGSRVVVVLADQSYFEQLYCRWEFQAVLEPFARGRPGSSVGGGWLSHLVVVLPAGNRPAELDRFPAEIQTTHWPVADVLDVVQLVRRQLDRSPLTVAQRYAELGQPEDAVRARLLELSVNKPPESLAGIRKYPNHFPSSKGDRFVGRADDLWRIDFAIGTLRGDSTAAALAGAIEGAGGVGKTQLAVEFVHRFGRRRFPDGIFWIDAEEPLEAQHHGILRTLDSSVPDLSTFRKAQRSAYDELADALDRASSGASILFVVDDIPEVPVAPLSRWCPALNKVTVLTTSRARLSAVEPIYPVSVGVLSSEAAVQLLTSGADSAASHADNLRVAEWVGRLPLALTVLNAALRLKGTSVQGLAAKARAPASQTVALDEQMKALRGQVPEGALRGVTEAFAESYALLASEAQEAARLLARLGPFPLPIQLVDALNLMPDVRISLTGRSFVTSDETAEPSVPVLGSMHRVLADYLRTRAVDAEAEWNRVRAALSSVLMRLIRSPEEWQVLQACLPHARHLVRTMPTPPGELKWREEAIRAIEEAVEVYRKLVEVKLESMLPASSPSSRAPGGHSLGEQEKKRQALEETVEAYRKLAEVRPEVFLRDLFASMVNLAVYLGESGQREEGLRATADAVAVYWKMIGAKVHSESNPADRPRPPDQLPPGGLRRPVVEGLLAIEEAVAMYRKLAEAKPDAFLPYLAMSLNNLSIRLGVVGRQEEGLRAAEEAVKMCRKLAADKPEGFLPYLATSLSNLGSHLGGLGRAEAGLKAVEESVELLRELTTVGPPYLLSHLATTLTRRSWLLDQLGRPDEARATAEEAMAIRSRLPELGGAG